MGVSPAEEPRQNYTRDPYLTDGLRGVIFIGEEDLTYAEIDVLNWENPPEELQ